MGHLKELRHYSATQLLAAGTDLNTVAGRLGHAEGSTTLRFYVQFTRPPTSAPPWSSPLSSTATARRSACASCTVSISRPLGADSLAALASDAGPFRD